MISISGHVQRLFDFPASPESAFSFFQNFRRVIDMLPKIEFVTWHPFQQNRNACRVCYHSIEMGLYSVDIFCDLYTEIEPGNHILHVKPLTAGIELVAARTDWYSLTGSGTFSSTSKFIPNQHHTTIDYSLNLQADIPIPPGLRLVPRGVLSGIASSIVRRRIEEIAEGFINRSIQTYDSLIPEP
jgi:hypothetical protein